MKRIWVSEAQRMRNWRKLNPKVALAYNRSIKGKYVQLKQAAKEKSRVLEISLEEYANLLKNAVCHYCRGPLSEAGYGLDRVDHRKGYTKENVVPCCGVKDGKRNKSCNMRKGYLESIGFVYPRTVELLMELLGGDTPA